MDWPFIGLATFCALQFILYAWLARRVRINKSSIESLWRKIPQWHKKVKEVSLEVESIRNNSGRGKRGR